MSEQRRRVYTPADVARWSQSISEGVVGGEFRERHGLPINSARQSAARLGLTLPEVVTAGRMRDAKAPATEDRSVMWFPTPRARRKSGATRRRMS